MKKLFTIITFLMFSISTYANDITGAGSTFVYPIIAKWADSYKKAVGTNINYQSIGSGGGIKQIQNKTVDFGATDMPLKPEDLKKDGLLQFPIINGGTVPVVNIPNIKAGQLKLTGPVLADIYLGKIKKWNDPVLNQLNKGMALPDLAITVVHRSDGSGTSFIWTNYLSKVSDEWKTKVGEGTAVQWPAGVGGKGNEGVASNVQQISGSIGYVEYAYALQNKMTFTQVRNSANKFVMPNAETFRAAAANAAWTKAENFYLILTNAPGAKSWPIAGSTFILMQQIQEHPEKALEALRFFQWAYRKGSSMASQLDYIPLPETVVKAIEKTWKIQMKTASGTAIHL